MKSPQAISGLGAVEINSPGEIINDDNVVKIGLDIDLIRVEPAEKYCVGERESEGPDWFRPPDDVDLAVRRDEETVPGLGPADQTRPSGLAGGENSDEDDRRVRDVEGGTADSSMVKHHRSRAMSGDENVLLRVNGEDSAIIRGWERAGSIVKTEINRVQSSLHCSEV